MVPKIVVIGASLGGGHALQTLLADLPGNFPLPVVIAQHRSKETDLRGFLARGLALPVLEPENGSPILAGRVYVAPADYHLFVDDSVLTLSLDPPVSHARPSIDVLFESAADTYRGQVVGVILSGTGVDGAKGLAGIVRAGGVAWIQEPASAEEKGMPAAALLATQSAEVLPLSEIGPRLCGLGQAGDE